MCRVLLYMGEQAVLPYDLLFAPDSSLIKQSFDPKFMADIKNLAGFGMIGWDYHSPNPEVPYFYKSHQLPFHDTNLLYLSKKIQVNTLLSHVRGVPFSTSHVVIDQNAHPFCFPNHTIALAHNGTLEDIELMKTEFVKYLNPSIIKNIAGSTDSEQIYALFVSRLKDPTSCVEMKEARDALVETLKIIRTIRIKLNISKPSPLNLFITNGNYSIITRFVFDYGRGKNEKMAFLAFHTLWLTYGESYGICDGIYRMIGSKKKSNIIIASEPLTRDHTTWMELPEYSMTTVWRDNGLMHLHIMDLNI